MRYIILLLITITLTGCGPIYKTVYDYKPPVSTTGKMCINQCEQNKLVCQQMCNMRNDTCRTQARQQALYDYEIYKQQQQRDHQLIEKTAADFDRSGQCSASCGCEESFNVCYTTCGGKINSRQVCTAFCDKQ